MRDFWTKLKEALRRGHRFATYEIWQIGTPGEEVPQGFITKQIRVIILLGSKLLDGMHMVRASALTLATLLSVVPFLAMTFYVIQTFNLGDQLYGLIQERLESVAGTVSGQPAPESSAQVGTQQPTAAASANAPPGEPATSRQPQQQAAAAPSTPEAAQNEQSQAGQTQSSPGESAGEGASTAQQQAASEEQSKTRELQRQIIRSLFQGVAPKQKGMENPVDTITRAADTIAKLANDAAKNRAAVTISGVILLVTTVFGLMANIEKTFNRIWGVRRTRSWYRMITDYLVITLLIPFFVAVVLGVMAALQSDVVREALGPFAFGLRLAQHALVVLVFTTLYDFVPNTRVKFRYALLAGLVAGSLWVLLSWGYVQFQFGLARYEVVLSAFAQFPMLLMWVYLSWAIVLLGCEVAYAYQNESTFALERFAEEASYAYREAIGLRAMIEVGYRFEKGLPELTVEDAARRWNVPMRLLADVLEALSDAGLLAPRATEPAQYQPARPLDRIRAGDVIHVLREEGTEPSRFRDDERFRRMFNELDRHDGAFGGATLEQLVESYEPALDDARHESEPAHA